MDRPPYLVDAPSAPFVSLVNREIRPDRLAYYLERLQVAAEHSAGEAGLLRCEVFSDRDNPCLLTILDVFADDAAYAFHIEQGYLARFRDEVADCFVGAPAQRILKLVGREKNVIDQKP